MFYVICYMNYLRSGYMILERLNLKKSYFNCVPTKITLFAVFDALVVKSMTMTLNYYI